MAAASGANSDQMCAIDNDVAEKLVIIIVHRNRSRPKVIVSFGI
jgi:hypothetical protein